MSAEPKRAASFEAAGFAPVHPRVEVDLRAEVVVARRVRAEAVRGDDRPVAALADEVRRARRCTLHPVPVEDEDARLARARRFLLRLLAERYRGRLLGRVDVGIPELAHRLLDVVGRGRQVRVPLEAVDAGLEDVTRRKRVGKCRVAQHGLRTDVLAAALTDLDVRGDHLDHLRQLRERYRVLDLVLERPDEQLLACVPVDVGVRVAEPYEVEGVRPVQPLIARLEVDLGVPARAPVVVVVAPIHVEPDTAELVDELAEAAEVDRDDVVDRQPREGADGPERAHRAAGGVGGVDLRDERRLTRAVDRHVEVAREREQRDRLLAGIRADEHQRVRA